MTDIEKKRLKNALISKGISTNAIIKMAIEILEEQDVQGDILDFGAGVGNLSKVLFSLNRFTSITCVDILSRPTGLDESILWKRQDLNTEFVSDKKFDAIFCIEVIEHLENPRSVFRNFTKILKPNGKLILTTPNQHSIRSKLAYLFGGHFAGFRGSSYPAHITALLKLDLERICLETGFDKPVFYYSDEGGIPKKPNITWQKILKIFKGCSFSDNLAIFTELNKS